MKRPLTIIVTPTSDPLDKRARTLSPAPPSCPRPLQSPQPISLVLPFLCVGSELVSAAQLASHGVSHVIDCRNTQEQLARGPLPKFPNASNDKLELLSLPLRDNHAENASKYFYCAIHFIEMARRCGGVVLVHCTRGISRSCALVCAYLIWYNQIGYRDCLAQLRLSRPEANPNVSFSLQLVEFAQQRERNVIAFEVSLDGCGITELSGYQSALTLINSHSGVLLVVNKLEQKQYLWHDGGEDMQHAAKRAVETLAQLHVQPVCVQAFIGTSSSTDLQALFPSPIDSLRRPRNVLL
ncbi:hypothetical protein BASA81_010987 [Batrachochytrium salamandrivorans]|nr:hypothetical protein BASA81_010987 [Batrachochytrium salamandrivorans]